MCVKSAEHLFQLGLGARRACIMRGGSCNEIYQRFTLPWAPLVFMNIPLCLCSLLWSSQRTKDSVSGIAPLLCSLVMPATPKLHGTIRKFPQEIKMQTQSVSKCFFFRSASKYVVDNKKARKAHRHMPLYPKGILCTAAQGNKGYGIFLQRALMVVMGTRILAPRCT
jgi:hypothetical protein